MDWFSVIVAFLLGFGAGRLYPLYRKFNKFLDKEHEKKSEI